jgi:glucosamine 6-phosphate synthetase-like amidotransferase/phosphosugar isomerase protein
MLVPDRTSHPFLTYDMIYEIPATIRETLKSTRFSSATGRLGGKDEFYFTGCGTAFFAAMLGAYPLHSSRFRSECVSALELGQYGYPLSSRTGLVGVSHSGITKATVDVLKFGRSKGACGVGITHYPDRPISEAADETIVVGNSPDPSRCHTKCYVAGAVACAKISTGILNLKNEAALAKDLAGSFDELPSLTEEVLKSTDGECREIADQNHKRARYYIVGSGANYANSLEAALKIMETSYCSAQGFDTEQILHGPWASIDQDTFLIVLAPKGKCYDRNRDLVKAAKIYGASVLAIVDEDDTDISSLCDSIKLPARNESLAPYLNIIPLYLISYYMSVKNGNNPDMLRYLWPKYWEARQIIFPPGTH